ncbi:hypothetical protein ACEXQE_05905 [Herbiconiux sp. P17]|uniref:hypothetical protein n=1 Tax=Herbiconiux wuyangfengii TaxID=3342794 RepID=UPI0035B751C2
MLEQLRVRVLSLEAVGRALLEARQDVTARGRRAVAVRARTECGGLHGFFPLSLESGAG